MISSDEAAAAQVAAGKVERILKVACVTFWEAIDIRSCVEGLEASNRSDILQSLENANADRAAGLIQKALFGRLLMGVMTAFDPVRSGDFHLRVGMDLIAEQVPRMVVLQRGGNLAEIEAAELGWAECLKFEPIDRLRTYRNKSVAHLSDPPKGMQDPIITELFTLAKMTADVAEHLAHGTGVAAVSLQSQVTPYRDSFGAFWEQWR